MKLLLIILSILIFPYKATASNIHELIEKTTVYLIKTWNDDKNLKNWSPPKVITVPIGTKLIGGECEGSNQEFDVTGSYYCPPDHTIILDPVQLKNFIKAFGNSSVAYVVAHEFAHAFQNALEIRLKAPNHELQADCLAGYFIQEGNKELEITRENILEMSSVAYAIGDKTHGTGAQRTYALLSGMGRVDADCSYSSIEKLVNGNIDDPLYKTFTRTRGSGKLVDLESSPYKKDALGLLGINLKTSKIDTRFRF